ncbi:gephyrin-like molybdotransferase Glp [Corynebacterium sphenisci]|uniref:molybdopterin molybdotransferase MoeA n=1 Tax=Corynebacterium sphenisci TaxID=191493 RepID=UPI000AE12B1B|nr:gephyrin-like molybdotransferase Glp [Corynebacterium sphenisci]
MCHAPAPASPTPPTPPDRPEQPPRPADPGRVVADAADYRRRLLADLRPTAPVPLPLARAHGLVLAGDVAAALPVPPFDNSAMDGFAVHAADLAAGPARLPVVADVPAGCPPPPLPAGAAARVMTGAPLPAGADAVVPVEDTDAAAGPGAAPATVRLPGGVAPGAHRRTAGEDVVAGARVLAAGRVLDAAALAAAAATGHGELPVHPRPRVAVLATGAELTPAGRLPGPGAIPDSNSVMLAALAGEFGAEVTGAGRAGDDPDRVLAALEEAAAGADLVLTAGGISAGAHDPLVALAAAGRLRLELVRTRVQPGAPQGHGRIGGARLLCLPGNPVAAFVSAHLHLRPMLDRLAGRGTPDHSIPVIVGEPMRRRPDLLRVVPVARDAAGRVRAPGGAGAPPRPGSGSHRVVGLAGADGLLLIDPGAGELPAGARARLLPFDDPATRVGGDG